MKIEQELKYRLHLPCEETIEELMNLKNINSYVFEEAQKKEIVDVYYDNQNFAISKLKSIFRFRVVDFKTFLVTFKTTVKLNNELVPLFIREEFEETNSLENLIIIHQKLIDLGLKLPEFDMKDFQSYGIWGLLKMWELREIFVCENTRMIRKIMKNNIQVAELCIDDVIVSTFGKKENFKEIEIEAIGEHSEVINELALHFESNYNNKIYANKNSKYETGIKLLLGDKNQLFEN